MGLTLLAAPVLLLLLLAPAAQAQENGEYDCGSYCEPYYDCEEPCTRCAFGPQYPDTYCYSGIVWTTCGASGKTCGQCTIVDTWEVDEEVSRTAAPPYFCGGSNNSWGQTNWSVFMQYNKQMRKVTYGTQICGGTTSTVVVSTTYFQDVCYDFVYPDCCQPSVFGCGAPDWRFVPPYEFDSYMECHD
jgi:hypothetical protein